MDYLYADKINNVISQSDRGNTDIIIENLVSKFYSEIVTADDQNLLNLAFSVHPQQEDLDVFLKTWDIEVFGSGKALMLAYLMKMYPYLHFTDYERPRLGGLLNFFRFANLNIIAHFTKVGRALNEAGITPMILKGGAMKFIRPELPRVMGDIDILTIGKDFEKACQISKDLGYVFGEDSSAHSVDLHTLGSNAGTLDIHRFLDFETNYDKSVLDDFYKRAEKKKVFGVDAFVPCYEDIVFMSLINLAKNLHNNTSSQGVLYTLFDCKFLKESKPDFDWNIIIGNVIKSNTQVQAYFAMKFVNKIIPGLLPEELFKNATMYNECVKYCNEVIFFRFYVHDLKMQCKKLKLKNAFCNREEFKTYINAKPKHWVLKRIRKNPTLVAVFLKVANKFKETKCA